LIRPIAIRAGRLGQVVVGPGVVRYYGNAHGPGGLRARVARHLAPDKRRDRWHVDALTRRLAVDRVLVDQAGDECQLVRRDLDSGEWLVAVAGFGSSDCRRCPSHLLVARRQPER
jgi:Uri superfamily endonuclease